MSQKTPIDVPSVNDVQDKFNDKIAKQCIINILKRHDKLHCNLRKPLFYAFWWCKFKFSFRT